MDKNDRRHSPRHRREATIQVILASENPKGRRDSRDLLSAKICTHIKKGVSKKLPMLFAALAGAWSVF